MTVHVSAERQARALRWMAEHIEEVGLAQGALYAGAEPPTTFDKQFAAPCCVIGAAHLYTSKDAAYAALQTLRCEVGGSIGYWSDASTKAEVVATLDRVADQLTEGVPL